MGAAESLDLILQGLFLKYWGFILKFSGFYFEIYAFMCSFVVEINQINII